MNLEQQLRLQAWVDGELSDAEAREIATFVQGHADAQALAGELRLTKGFLAGNEPNAPLQENGDFYWSRIRREIEREESSATKPGYSWKFAWRRLMAPLSGVALIAFLSILSFNVFHRESVVDDGASYLVEVENLSEHIGSISYRSQSENMFVVYLYKKDQDVETDSEPEPIDDTFLQ